MQKRRLNLVVCLALCLMGVLLPLAGCGGTSTTQPPQPPAITLQPQAQTVTAGQKASFSISATNASSYQWRRNGADLLGSSGPVCEVGGTTPAMNGDRYSVVVSGSGGSVVSSEAVLNVQYYTLTAHPHDVTVLDGGQVTLTAKSTGNPTNATYQWQRAEAGSASFADLTGETSESLVLASLRYGTSNGVQVRRKDIHVTGTYFTNAAVVSVAALAPSVTLEPQDRSVQVGQPAAFTMDYQGTEGSIQWFRKKGTEPGVLILNANSKSLLYTPASEAESGEAFYAVVTNPKGTCTTRSAVLTVTPIQVSPHFTVHPKDQTGHIHQTVTFTASASGVPVPTYTWKKNGVILPEERGTTLSVRIESLIQEGDAYVCTAVNGVGSSIDSEVARLHVLPALVAPWFISQAPDQAATAGGSATFNWEAGGNPAPDGAVEELKDSNWVQIASGFTLTLPNVQTSDSGRRFRCVATSTEGRVISNTAALSVAETPRIELSLNPTSLATPRGVGVRVDMTLTYLNGASGAARYKAACSVGARFDPTFIQVGPDGMAMNLTIPGDQVAGEYLVTVTVEVGSLTAEKTVAVRVMDWFPFAVQTSPSDATAIEGGAAAFSVAAWGGKPPYHYQWMKNDSTPVGGDSDTLSLIGVTLAESGSYYNCVITDSAPTPNRAESSIGRLTVLPAPSFEITVSANGPLQMPRGSGVGVNAYLVRRNGFSGTVNYSALNSLGASIQTKIDLLPNGDCVLSLTVPTDHPLGDCTVTLTGSSGTLSFSQVIKVTVLEYAVMAVACSPSDVVTTAGGTATFPVRVWGGKPPYHYQWYRNDSVPVGPDSEVLTLTGVTAVDNNTYYHCVITDSAPTPNQVTGGCGYLRLTSGPCYDLGLSAVSVSVVHGGTVALNAYVTPKNGFSGSITFVAYPPPFVVHPDAPIQASWSACTDSGGVLTLQVPNECLPGIYTVWVLARSADQTVIRLVTVTVT